ncbi:MAG: amidophosphoribosyltransferase [Candidatus Poribacteria bacterium]|nr:MAG: amidophosphoribosyltransferase [Candidatus Poribacteria bacterium]
MSRTFPERAFAAASDLGEKPREECGVFGVVGHPEAAWITYQGLFALQHRGQESAGIVSSDGRSFYQHRGMGLVGTVFRGGNLEHLRGHLAVGHNRYSTAGSSTLQNAQPFVAQYARGPIAVAHNGNFVNAFQLRRKMESEGQIFVTTSDTEVFAHLIGASPARSLEDRIVDALREIRGAYSLLCMSPRLLVAVRDPSGFRPLWMGQLEGAILFASETCALDAVDATIEREVEPGEMVLVSLSEGGPQVHSFRLPLFERRAHCIFELLYLARADSVVFGESVALKRLAFGRQLAREAPAEADLVTGIPDSANMAALGYAQESGIPFQFALARNQYVGRTFIEPQQRMREKQVGMKLNPIRDVVAGRRIVLVDDSLMRGTTMRKLVKRIRNAGATEVHVRIAAPPTRYPCFYGVDFPTKTELIASDHTLEEIRRYIRADSLGYLSIQGMLTCVKEPATYCTACFSGRYPLEFEGQDIQQLSFDFSHNRDRN